MNQNILNILILICAGILFFCTLFSILMYKINKHTLLKKSVNFWLAGVASFIIQGMFANNLSLSFFGFTTNIFCFYYLLQIFEPIVGVKIPRKIIYTLLATGFLISTALLNFSASSSFILSTTPFCIAVFTSFLIVIFWNFKSSAKLDISLGFRVILFLNGLHFLDYPFLRLNASLSVYGFTAAILFYIFYGISIPIFILKHITDAQKTILENLVQERTLDLQKSNHALLDSNIQLEASNNELEQASKLNQVLMGVLAHDLANPLQVIFYQFTVWSEKTETYMLDFKERNEKCKKAIATITDILKDSRTAHNLRLGKGSTQDLGQVDVISTLNEVISTFEERLNRKNLIFKLENKISDYSLVFGEKNWLKNQVFSNLISNAIKFSHSGGEIVARVNQKNDRVVIQIQDYGVGINEDMKQYIFDITASSSKNGTDGEQGTGFGLPIVKQYVKMMSGEIRLLSKEESDKGTCFEMVFKKCA